MNRSIFKLVKNSVSIIVIVLVFDVIFGQVSHFILKGRASGRLCKDRVSVSSGK